MSIEILIVDDEDMIRWTLRQALASSDCTIHDFPAAEPALIWFAEHGADIVLLDIRLPDMNGLELLPRLRELDPSVPVIMMTAFGDVDTAVTAMKRGAYDYLTKPYNLAEVHQLIEHIRESMLLKSQFSRIRERVEDEYCQILGESLKVRQLRQHIAMAAQSDKTTVLIRGESGTGKELAARQIHLQSTRKHKPFVDVNAAAVSETLLESEIFGHEKGAFTDAQRQKKGLFELANGGTLFLDEIGDLSPHLQAKLLRVLEERRFRRVGGDTDIVVDVRVIAATNTDLEKAMEEGNWRRDLYYRLNVFSIKMPSLRDHPEDIALLAKAFLERFRRAMSKNVSGFAPGVLEGLSHYAFPGNVRELKNIVERATILEQGNLIQFSSLPEAVRPHREPVVSTKATSVTSEAPSSKPWTTPGFTLKDHVNGLEKKIVEDALAECGGNRSQAAKLLGMSRFALRHQLIKHGLGE